MLKLLDVGHHWNEVHFTTCNSWACPTAGESEDLSGPGALTVDPTGPTDMLDTGKWFKLTLSDHDDDDDDEHE